MADAPLMGGDFLKVLVRKWMKVYLAMPVYMNIPRSKREVKHQKTG
jgi:hypothetical protein